MKCINCGSEIPNSSGFCSICGAMQTGMNQQNMYNQQNTVQNMYSGEEHYSQTELNVQRRYGQTKPENMNQQGNTYVPGPDQERVYAYNPNTGRTEHIIPGVNTGNRGKNSNNSKKSGSSASRTGLIIALVIAGLIIVGAVIAFSVKFLGGSDGKEPDTSVAVVTTEKQTEAKTEEKTEATTAEVTTEEKTEEVVTTEEATETAGARLPVDNLTEYSQVFDTMMKDSEGTTNFVYSGAQSVSKGRLENIIFYAVNTYNLGDVVYTNCLSNEQAEAFVYEVIHLNRYYNELGIDTEDKDRDGKLTYSVAFFNEMLSSLTAMDASKVKFGTAGNGIQKNGDNIDFMLADGEIASFVKIARIVASDKYVSVKYIVSTPLMGAAEGDDSFVYDYAGDAVFEIDSSSKYGYRLLYLKKNAKANIYSAAASSTLPNSTSSTYVPANLYDGQLKTTWCEDASDDGIGQTVSIFLGDNKEISGLLIANGYAKDSDSYFNNSMPIKIRVEVDDNLIGDFYMSTHTDFPYDDWSGIQYTDAVIFDKPLTGNKITLTILDTRSGRKYKDTCISEILVY